MCIIVVCIANPGSTAKVVFFWRACLPYYGDEIIVPTLSVLIVVSIAFNKVTQIQSNEYEEVQIPEDVPPNNLRRSTRHHKRPDRLGHNIYACSRRYTCIHPIWGFLKQTHTFLDHLSSKRQLSKYIVPKNIFC